MAGHPSRLFFAYGSGLSLSDTLSRCRTSTFYSIAVLRNHRWFINERGYPNITPSSPSLTKSEDVVWGILYAVGPFDVDLLDKDEGVPWGYTKEDMDVEAVSISEDGRSTRREVVRALVYIDREKVLESYPYPDFVGKINQGIQEAIERGVPKSYFDKAVRGQLVTAEATNGAQARTEHQRSTSQQNVALPPPSPQKDSDLAVQTQGIAHAGQSLSGASHRSNPSQNGRPRGLQDSMFAPEKSNGTGSRAIGYDRDTSATHRSTESRSRAPATKQLECWYWRNQGSCTRQDHECNFAHHDTGTVALPPGKKGKGFTSGQLRKAPRSDRPDRNINPQQFSDQGSYEEPAADAFNQGSAISQTDAFHQGPAMSQTDAFNQGSAAMSQTGAFNQGSATTSQTRRFNPGSSAPVQSWDTGEGSSAPVKSWQGDHKSENPPSQQWGPHEPPSTNSKGTTWDGRVQNLMDSQPEWMVSNDRKDVQW